MTLFLLTFSIIVLVIAAMAIGVICGRPPIRGSCGGLGNERGCELCDRRCRRDGHASNT